MPKISRVKLLKKVKSNGNWILVPALFDSKGRVRRDHVMIEGRDEVHSEGSYYLDGGMAESDIARARGQTLLPRQKKCASSKPSSRLFAVELFRRRQPSN